VVGAGSVLVVELGVVGVGDAVVVTLVATVAAPPSSSSPQAASVRVSASGTTSTHRHVIEPTVRVNVPHVAATDGECESCGAPDEHLYPVHRRYVTPAEWDTPGRDVTLDEVERWCFSCCTSYPHVPVDAA
jgi:hypothetical protein